MEYKHKIISVIVLVFLNNLTETQSQEWNEPFFSATNRADVTFGTYSNGRQPIEMNEEIAPSIDIVIINFEGITTPQLTMNYGSNTLLGAVVQPDGKRWKVVVTKQQDYENPQMKSYIFSIAVLNGQGIQIQQQVILNIKNILDNHPVMTIGEPCKVDELKKDFTSDCVFTVHDDDQVVSGGFTFKIFGSFQEDELFGFVENRKVDDYNMEYNLTVKQELDYSLRTLYNFRTEVYDAANNDGSINTIVEVNDVPNKDPIWIRPFATARFFEKEEKTFEVEAIDGDTFINRQIWYTLVFEAGKDYSNIISIEKETGKIAIKAINRDELKNEFFPFTIFAYKFNNATWGIYGSAALIIDDKNDNPPVIDLQPAVLKIREAEYLTLNFTKFLINDIDLGPHATYDVILAEPITGEKYSTAFSIVPPNGYQETKFSINVVNALLLDYEDPVWRDFTIIVRAVENDNPTDHTREQEIKIELINWNDEIPEFETSEYTAIVLESVPGSYLIGTVKATDKDVDDFVRYSLIGGVNNILEIKENGEIYTKADNTFDYERQQELMIQIQAEDTLQTYPEERLHRVFAQLTINIGDVNDETPEIRMPRNVPILYENPLANKLVTDGIVGLDLDTNASLIFEIDWDTSYAMHIKSGAVAEKEFYENCFIIKTVPNTVNNVSGHLFVNPDFPLKIDYEKYEVIYLTIRIIDRNQEIGEDRAEGVLTVSIGDENDNPPRFIGDTLTTQRSVIEEALTGTLIGTVFATDDDGPPHNVIDYTLRPMVNTPADWLEIDPATGVLTVKANLTIDCDDPKIDDLSYEITLTDTVHTVTGEIKIAVIDINNKFPQIENFDKVIQLYENATTGDHIVTVNASDMDRDAPHNKLQFTINYMQHAELQKFFKINDTTGDLIVQLQGENHLDRDEGAPTHDIHMNVEDNYQGNGRRNPNSTMVRLILLDVNDKSPEMPSETTKFSVEEDKAVGSIIEDQFYAPDKDDPATPNAQVSYEILTIKRGDDNSSPSTDPTGIFVIESYDNKYARIKVGKALKGYHGEWKLEILAYDHGDEYDSQISLSSTATYTVTVEPVNYNNPEIVFPKAGDVIRLRDDNQEVGKRLIRTDGTLLQRFAAKDEDGGRFGNVSFTVLESPAGNLDYQYFDFIKINDKESDLIIVKSIESKTYRVNIRATDDSGNGKSSPQISLAIAFINMRGEPYFDIESFTTDFTENELGMEEKRIMPEAIDPKNAESAPENEKIPIYYFIYATFNPQDVAYFKLDKTTRTLELTKELDREAIASHTIKILATNSINYPGTLIDEKLMLTIVIKVNDVNDNPPKFDQDNYGVGITSRDNINKILFTVHADDPDEIDTITYSIVPGSIITTSGANIEDVKENFFALNGQTGNLTLNTEVQDSMKGIFKFRVEATDEVGHTDECDIKIYIVAESNRVTFIFFNNIEEVNTNANRQFLANTFTEMYDYESNIDDVTKGAISGVASEALTNVRVHFIKDNEPIEASVVQSRTSDITFLAKLRIKLQEQSLILNDVPSKTEEAIAQQTATIQIMLIVTTVILGMLCIILTAAFAIRTRNLNRQLKAMSATDFGSISSNMNRREAPTTNYFAVEGSNPVLNHNNLMKGQFDDLSLQSDESDFIGIEDDPTFMTKTSAYGNGDSNYIKNENPLANIEFEDDHIVSSKF